MTVDIPQSYLDSIGSLPDEWMRQRAMDNLRRILQEGWKAADQILSWNWTAKNAVTTRTAPPACRLQE